MNFGGAIGRIVGAGAIFAVSLLAGAGPASAQIFGRGGFLPFFDDQPQARPNHRHESQQSSLVDAIATPFAGVASFFEDLSIRRATGQTTRRLVNNSTGEAPGTVVIDTPSRKLYLVLPDGRAYEYGVGVGRQGFEWKGVARVGRKAEWLAWVPPPDMLKRRPDLPRHMDGGVDNPLGARALYLYSGSRDTMFRIHGTNEADSIGHAVSSGCIRLLNSDVVDLYSKVPVGTRVVVR
jgi:lipoprotein-anchoring transpeptidase ErfK/SrfK